MSAESIMLQPEHNECQRCGQCCAHVAYRLHIDPEDIRRWIEESRYDILQYILVCLNNGNWIAGTEITLKDVEIMVGADMIDPNDDFIIPCPFLDIDEHKKLSCSIQESKPISCAQYRPWEMGEWGLNQKCMTVLKLKQSRQES